MKSGVVRAVINERCVTLDLNRPPFNAIGLSLLADLGAAIQRFDADADIDAIVVTSVDGALSSEIDITAIGDPAFCGALGDVCRQIEDSGTPIVAALSGAVRGPGVAIALSAHHRIGQVGVTLGLPDVHLGLIPCGGVTARLPRVVGPVAALQMLISGRPVGDTVAKRLGLLEALVDEDVLVAAHRLGQQVAARDGGPAKTRTLRAHVKDAKGFLEAVAAARANGAPSQLREEIADAVEGAFLLPFDVYCETEKDTYLTRLARPESRALRHIHAAERTAEGRVLRREHSERAALPNARAALQALVAAQDTAIMVLREDGVPEADIDGAMVDLGYRIGAFGTASGPVGARTDEIQRRIIAALAAEGVRLVARAEISEFADVDALAVHQLGFPRSAGGPLYAAYQMGLLSLIAEMTLWSEANAIWEVPPAMRQAAMLAGGFDAVKTDISA